MLVRIGEGSLEDEKTIRYLTVGRNGLEIEWSKPRLRRGVVEA